MTPQVLKPWDRQEACEVKHAAWIARRSPATIRAWAEQHHIGRRIVDGAWMISLPALLMLLDDDRAALNAYLAGDRRSDAFEAYRERANRFLPAEIT
ncbi:hypothetical protein [Methylobacterium sp. WL8]|uniref:hypothetical protein n=1 Tax=Methylobacterium sp. WL8 TaxID=2603899 RepID=UPI0011CA8B8B|nr:hypothetical protein [Methylobacterium sp. WL8]TXN76687.1 hypothetical protein FV234_24470 [Methylobacterium sp. WL8]